MREPSPTECDHPDCTNEPIVGLNDIYVCKEHIDWAMSHVKSPREVIEELVNDR